MMASTPGRMWPRVCSLPSPQSWRGHRPGGGAVYNCLQLDREPIQAGRLWRGQAGMRQGGARGHPRHQTSSHLGDKSCLPPCRDPGP